MSSLVQFTLDYINKCPGATAEDIENAYRESRQGKQAMNTRLLGG